jgi:hypothetical protein
VVFRRRRAEGADELADAGPPEDARHDEDEPGAHGPWDVTDGYPERDRIDLGSLRIPAVPGLDVHVNFAGEQALSVIVQRGDSMLQMQAFAAPKRAGLWGDIRHELIDELRAAGGHGDEATGPFGPEVRARVRAEQAPGARSAASLQSARFLGADGPRWFLRGVISGPAAVHPGQAKMLEEVFADTVVVRGEHPAPPRDLLELRLPADAQQALAEQLAAAEQGREPLSPFVRGPEITETR